MKARQPLPYDLAVRSQETFRSEGDRRASALTQRGPSHLQETTLSSDAVRLELTAAIPAQASHCHVSDGMYAALVLAPLGRCQRKGPSACLRQLQLVAEPSSIFTSLTVISVFTKRRRAA